MFIPSNRDVTIAALARTAIIMASASPFNPPAEETFADKLKKAVRARRNANVQMATASPLPAAQGEESFADKLRQAIRARRSDSRQAQKQSRYRFQRRQRGKGD